MYFITKKDSDTGKKFAKIDEQMDIVDKAASDFARAHGTDEYCVDRWAAAGGCEMLIFPASAPPDPKLWKKSRECSDGYMPRLTSAQGKELKKQMKALPVVSILDLNMCIGFNSAFRSRIGFNRNNAEYYGIVTNESWKIKMPTDCEEVLTSRFRELFPEDETN